MTPAVPGRAPHMTCSVLVHEAICRPAVEYESRTQIAHAQHVNFGTFMMHMNEDYSPAEDVARIAQEAGVTQSARSAVTRPSLRRSRDIAKARS